MILAVPQTRTFILLRLCIASILTVKPRWSAIAKGAVCRGLEDPHGALVSRRLARKNYGALVSQYFDGDKHDEEDAVICDYTGKKMAENQIRWLVVKGTELPVVELESFKIDIAMCFWEEEGRECSAYLIGSCDDVPSTNSHGKGIMLEQSL